MMNSSQTYSNQSLRNKIQSSKNSKQNILDNLPDQPGLIIQSIQQEYQTKQITAEQKDKGVKVLNTDVSFNKLETVAKDSNKIVIHTDNVDETHAT